PARPNRWKSAIRLRLASGISPPLWPRVGTGRRTIDFSRDEDQHKGSSGRPGAGAPGPGRESGEFSPMAGEDLRSHLPALLRRLREAYPDSRYELDWEDPLQLLVATILAAQCTDERVNAVTPALFANYRDAEAFARADLADLEEAVR